MKWLQPLLFQTHELAGPFRRYWKIANSVENMMCADVVRVQVALKWIKIKLIHLYNVEAGLSVLITIYGCVLKSAQSMAFFSIVRVHTMVALRRWLAHAAILLSIFYAEQYQISTGKFRK